MAYTTRQQVEQYLNVDLSDVSSAVTAWIASVKSIIDNYVGYSFDSASADKYYDIPKMNTLFTDRFYGTPTITIYNYDGSIFKTLVEGVGHDFVAGPYNYGYSDRITFLRDPYFFDGIWSEIDQEDKYQKNKRIKVTATFGNGSTIPEDIQLCATMMVASVAEKRTKGGTPTQESLGDYSISFKDVEASENAVSIKSILDSYAETVI